MNRGRILEKFKPKFFSQPGRTFSHTKKISVWIFGLLGGCHRRPLGFRTQSRVNVSCREGSTDLRRLRRSGKPPETKLKDQPTKSNQTIRWSLGKLSFVQHLGFIYFDDTGDVRVQTRRQFLLLEVGGEGRWRVHPGLTDGGTLGKFRGRRRTTVDTYAIPLCHKVVNRKGFPSCPPPVHHTINLYLK